MERGARTFANWRDKPHYRRMTHWAKPVREWRGVDEKRFRDEIAPLKAPAVLRGLVSEWPAVIAAASPAAACAYIERYDAGLEQQILVGPPAIGGRFFYRDDMSGVNFERRKTTISGALKQMLAAIAEETPGSLYIESTPVAEKLPGFELANAMALAPASSRPRIWIGNAVNVQTHFDLNDNIACVVAGRRRFTLFPPDQVGNLYVGPLDFTLSGPPVSMVDVAAPDLERFPRFAAAQEAAQTAELAPGDAIYIPYGWWHNVRSLERFNILVNYWWNEARPERGAPFDALLYAVMTIRDLPEDQRGVWRSLFDYFAFKQSGEPLAHLAVEHRGMMGELTPERVRTMRAILLKLLGG